jgi:hypothetical protein
VLGREQIVGKSIVSTIFDICDVIVLGDYAYGFKPAWR